jgi:hypothetical protein
VKRLPNWAWLAWCLTVALTGGALEIIGLLTKAEGDTLSERTRERLGIQPRRPWRMVAIPAFTLAMVALPVWFYFHITNKWSWWNPWG